MLTYYYNSPIGKYEIKQGENTYGVDILRGNCMWVEIYTYELEGKTYESLIGFWMDAKHMNRAEKNGHLELTFSDHDNYIFNASYLNNPEYKTEAKEVWKAIQLLVKHGKKVTIV